MLQWLKHLRETSALHRAAFWEWPSPLELNPFHGRSWWKSCNEQDDDDPVMYVCWDTSCPSMSDQVTEEGCTHTLTETFCPVSIPGAKREKSGWPDQQIISANQQVYFWNLSYMLILSSQELLPKVCISAGNGCILHALKYYNVGFALLDLYIMRGALTWGGIHSGREEVSDHFYGACDSR